MEHLVDEILLSLNQGEAGLVSWLDANQDKISVELAHHLHERYNQSMETKDLRAAHALALAETYLYNRLMTMHLDGSLKTAETYELAHASLNGYLNFLEISFNFANAENEYHNILMETDEVAYRAQKLKLKDLVFHAYALSAECSYFAYSITRGDARDRWLWNIFLRLISTAKAGDSSYLESAPGTFERFASLLATVLHETAWMVNNETEEEESFKQLIPLIEKMIPIDFQFSNSNDDPGAFHKTNLLTVLLASYSYAYGDKAIAKQRLNAGIDRADKSKDLETWLHIVSEHYKLATVYDPLSSEIAKLRASIRERSDLLRIRFHSRVGRFWAAQELDRILGIILQQEFAEIVHETSNNDISEGLSSVAGFTSTISQAFSETESLKARNLLDYMHKKFKNFSDKVTAAQIAESERQILRFNKLESQDREYSVMNQVRITSQFSIGSEFDRFSRRKMLSSIEDQYSLHNAGFYEVQQITPVSTIASALSTDEAIIEYFLPYPEYADSILRILVVTKNGVMITSSALKDHTPQTYQGFSARIALDGKEPFDTTPLNGTIASLLFAIQQHDISDTNEMTANTYLQILYELLISPIVKLNVKPENFRRWIIIPHGMLHHVPFSALRNQQGRYLIEEVSITICPSSSIWHRLQSYKRPKAENFLAFGNPELTNSNAPPLPETEKEISRISRILKSFNTKACIKGEATETELQVQVKDKGIIHIATHGEYPEDDIIDFHRLLLSPSTQDDGRLNAEEIRKMDLSSTRLVVLSVCNGGVYRVGPGDEPFGLISAFLTAGAENILSTLWSIEDDIARVFMVEFYKQLLQLDPSSALQETCRKFINDRALLRHWASLVLTGTGRPIYNSV